MISSRIHALSSVYKALKQVTPLSTAQQNLISNSKVVNKLACLSQCSKSSSCLSCTYSNDATSTCNLYNTLIGINGSGVVKVDLYSKASSCK